MAESNKGRLSENDQRLARRSSAATISPFHLLDRFADEMDRLFDDFGFGRTSLSRIAPGLMSRQFGSQELWRPAVEVFQRNSDLVVRADLPGLGKDDVKVDVTDDAITISGERRTESEHEEGGIYRSERQYGSFSRTVPLPEGAITDQAKATFNKGVLEVTIPAPPEPVRRGRRIEIADAATAEPAQSKK